MHGKLEWLQELTEFYVSELRWARSHIVEAQQDAEGGALLREFDTALAALPAAIDWSDEMQLRAYFAQLKAVESVAKRMDARAEGIEDSEDPRTIASGVAFPFELFRLKFGQRLRGAGEESMSPDAEGWPFEG